MIGLPSFPHRHSCATAQQARWLAALVVLVFIGGAPRAVGSDAPAAEAARFQAIVAQLASPEMEGRGVGTAGLERARDVLATAFEQAGLEPAVRTTRGRRYVQFFDVSLGARVAAQSLTLEATGDAARVRFDAGGDFNALGFSAVGAFEGEPAVVGYGIVAPRHDYNSYGEAHEEAVEGRVVIALRYEPMDAAGKSRWIQDERGHRWTRAAALVNKAQWAADRGAAALLVVDPHAKDDGGPLLRTAATAGGGAVDIPVMHMRNTTFRRILEAAGRDALEAERVYEQRANEGATRPDVLEGVTLRGHVELAYPEVRVANVVGMVPGEGELRDEVVVLGAHYDHLGFGGERSLARSPGGEPIRETLHPGADDNASGVAGLLIAAARYQRFAEAHPETPRRTVLIVAFSAEEVGLHGAQYLVAHPDELAVPLANTVAMLNLDMIGRLREALYVFGMDSGEQWERLLPADPAALPAAVELDARGTVTGLGDHAIFYGELGVPVLHLFTGLHEDYHRPGDTAEKINAEGGAAVARFTANLLRKLATRDEPIGHEQARMQWSLPRDVDPRR